MTTQIGIGFSQHPAPEQAFKEAAITVKNQINLPTLDFVLTFFTAGYAHQGAIESVQRILQPIRMAGAMTPGLIVNDHSEPRGVAMLGVSSKDIQFGTTLLDNLSFMNSRDAGFKAARDASADSASPLRHGFLALTNSVQANLSPTLLGLQEFMGRAVAFSGGICCDDKRNGGLLLNKNVLSSDGILGIMLGGQTPVAVAARHGWKPLGKPRIVDDAKGNLIKRIDQKPAISLYQDYFSEELKNLEQGDLGNLGLLYPLGFNTDRQKEYLLRHPIKSLPDGSIVCQAEVAIGSRVHLMIGDKDACRHAAQDAAIDARNQLFGRAPKLLLVLESLARRQLFGRASTKELTSIKEILGLTVPLFGMYTYGEIAPLGSAKENRITQLQNASIVIVAIG